MIQAPLVEEPSAAATLYSALSSTTRRRYFQSPMAKRKTSESSRSSSPSIHAKASKKLKISASNVVPAEKIQKFLKKSLDKLLKKQNESGRILSTEFVELPSKKLYPDYYKVIKNPMSLNLVKDNLKKGSYLSLGQFKRDIDLIFENAMTFNVEESEIHQDAIVLKKFMKDTLDSYSEDQPAKVGRRKSLKLSAADTKKLFLAISSGNFKDFEGFVEMPGFNPDMLADNGLFDKKFKWTPLMCASFYNQEKIARKLLDIGAKIEQEDTWYGGTALAWAAFGGNVKLSNILVKEYGANPNAKNSQGQVPFDLVPNPEDKGWIGVLKKISLKLKEPSSTRVLSETMQTVIDSLIGLKDKTGRSHAEYYMKLPKKKEIPGYYQVIRQPISFAEVGNKVKTGKYPDIDKFLDDVYRIFSNAQLFNADHTIAFKDSKILEKKLNELVSEFPEAVRSKKYSKKNSLSIKISPPVSESQKSQSSETVASSSVSVKVKPPKVKLKMSPAAVDEVEKVEVVEPTKQIETKPEKPPKEAVPAPSKGSEMEIDKEITQPVMPKPTVPPSEDRVEASSLVQQPPVGKRPDETYDLPCMVSSFHLQMLNGRYSTQFNPTVAIHAACISVPYTMQYARLRLSLAKPLSKNMDTITLAHAVPYRIGVLNSRRIEPVRRVDDPSIETSDYELHLSHGANVFEFICIGKLSYLLELDHEKNSKLHTQKTQDQDIRQVFRLVMLRM